jgi:hypothetical protein
MTPNLMHALIVEHQRELERQAGCCTPAAERRRSIAPPGLMRRITARHRYREGPAVCCA